MNTILSNKYLRYSVAGLFIVIFLSLGFMVTTKTVATNDEQAQLMSEIKDLQSTYAKKAEERRQYAAACVMENSLTKELTALNAQAQAKRDQINAIKVRVGKLEGK